MHALLTDKDKSLEYAKIMTLEMGKPIEQAKAEVAKCAGNILYNQEHTMNFLKDYELKTVVPNQRAYVQFDSVGPILDIVPWNFPFWMPFKSLLPPLILGNPILLKHSPSTPQCGEALEKIFREAGFEEGEFQNLYVTNEQAEKVIGDKRVSGVKFTGSTRGGKEVAAAAGKHMKKGCFELGGSDPFIVLDDADLNLAVEKGYVGRMVNSAQACINAKRFIIHDSIYDKFRDGLIEKIKSTAKLGDPMDSENVNVGPLAIKKNTEELRQ